MLAFVFVNARVNSNREFVEKIGEIKGVREVYELTGDIDVLVKIEAGNMEEISETVFKIRRLRDVSSTDTRLVICQVK